MTEPCVNGHTGGRFPSGRCKQCLREADARWRAKWPERIKAKEKARWINNREVERARGKEYRKRTGRTGRCQRAKRMGAPPEALKQLTCDVCGGTSNRTMHLDHDHVTGKFRGVLCNGCNTSLGQLNEDPERIERLAAYARRFK